MRALNLLEPFPQKLAGWLSSKPSPLPSLSSCESPKLKLPLPLLLTGGSHTPGLLMSAPLLLPSLPSAASLLLSLCGNSLRLLPMSACFG
jgi:hypothetical protein